jgi:hypothetical protein
MVLRDSYIGGQRRMQKRKPEKLIKILRESDCCHSALSSIEMHLLNFMELNLPLKSKKLKIKRKKIKEAYKEPDYIYNNIYKREKFKKIK